MNSWNPFKYPPRAVLKAIYGFLLPGVVLIGGAFARAATDANKPVTKYDIIAGLVAMFVTGGAVFASANTPPGEITQREADRGAVGVLFVVGLFLLGLAVLGLLHVIGLSLTVSIIVALIGVVLMVLDHRGTLRR